MQGFASGNVGAAGLPVEDGLLVLEHLCLQALESVRRGWAWLVGVVSGQWVWRQIIGIGASLPAGTGECEEGMGVASGCG